MKEKRKTLKALSKALRIITNHKSSALGDESIQNWATEAEESIGLAITKLSNVIGVVSVYPILRDACAWNPHVDLKPCPFCGGPAEFHESNEFQYVQCGDCLASVESEDADINAAVELWQSRYKCDTPQNLNTLN